MCQRYLGISQDVLGHVVGPRTVGKNVSGTFGDSQDVLGHVGTRDSR